MKGLMHGGREIAGHASEPEHIPQFLHERTDSKTIRSFCFIANFQKLFTEFTEATNAKH